MSSGMPASSCTTQGSSTKERLTANAQACATATHARMHTPTDLHTQHPASPSTCTLLIRPLRHNHRCDLHRVDSSMPVLGPHLHCLLQPPPQLWRQCCPPPPPPPAFWLQVSPLVHQGKEQRYRQSGLVGYIDGVGSEGGDNSI